MRKLKRLFIFILILGAAGAAAYYYFYKDVPGYKEARNLKLLAFTKEKISASVDVVCHNPNRMGLKLSRCDFDVFANGKEACKVKQNFASDIPAESDFTVPLTISFSPLKIFKPIDLLASGLQSLQSQKVDLKYKGDVFVSLVGQEIKIPVEFEENLPLKKAN